MPESSRSKKQHGRVTATKRHMLAPLPSAHFRVFVDGEELGMLSLSPLHWLTEGEADPELRQTVVLRRAASQDRRLYDWYRSVAMGKQDLRKLTVVQLDRPAGTVVNIWRLERALPVRWTGPGFNALATDFATEELEIRYASIHWRDSF